MKALVCRGSEVRLEDHPEPAPTASEVVLSVRRAGICSTDLEIAKGYMGFEGVLGHEVLGEVIDGGQDAAAALAGRRVVSEINCSCLQCPTCLAGGRNHCPHRTVLGILNKDGGMAERVAVPVANLHVVPDALDDDIAVFIEPLAAAMHTLDEAPVRAGERVLVLGDGKLGSLIALALAQRGDLARLTLCGKHAKKRAIVERVGVEAIAPDSLGGQEFDLVVEATGSPTGLAAALSALRPQGTLVLKSTYAGRAEVDLAPIVINELKVVGSRCGAFPRAIEALERGAIDPRPLIESIRPLAEAKEAFREAQKRGVRKVLLRGNA